MIEFCWQRALVPAKDFPDQEEVFFLASHQQDAQEVGPELCRGGQGESFATLITSESFGRGVGFDARQASLGGRRSPRTGMGRVEEVGRQAHEELRHLLQRRAEVMRRIGTIKQTIAGLANLFGDGVLSDELLELVDRKSSGRQPGFTKACRMVLMDSNRALSARDVCDRIQQKAPPMLARHKDHMASVTTLLIRLAANGEARAVALQDCRRARQWVAGCGSQPPGLPA